MPTESENIQYLYLVLTNDGNPVIDWEAVGDALNLKKGAVSKRWSRLRHSLDKGASPSPSSYQFLWLCVKHSTRVQPFNWAEIAAKCNTTVGAASKRYSRMKKDFEDGDEGPSSPAANTTPVKSKVPPKSRVKKNGEATGSGDDTEDTDAPPPAKRKLATSKKAPTPTADEVAYKLDDDADDEGEAETPSKRTKLNKTIPKPKPKAKLAVKEEPAPEDSRDDFVDAQEHLSNEDDTETYEAHHKRTLDWLESSG